MDLSFSESQEEIRGLAHQILETEVTSERLKALAASSDHFDRETWSELGKANLLGLSLPEPFGGSGLGFFETCIVLEQVGRTVAQVPVLASVVMAGLPIAQFGSPESRRQYLPSVSSGETVMSAALVEDGAALDAPQTRARRSRSGGWILNGTKICVPYGNVAERVLVPATTAKGALGVFIVDTAARGVSREMLETTSGQPESTLVLTSVKVADSEVLGDPLGGAEILEWIRQRATAALCVVTAGLCDRVVRLTADYTKTREQFGHPIASFQAVGQRAADAYIDAEGVRLTAWQAAWRLSEGLPAATEVAIAKFWAADGGQRVVHAGQHLHGGIGVDRDYPLHRYFLWAKHTELTLGGATGQLLRLGEIMAAEPA